MTPIEAAMLITVGMIYVWIWAACHVAARADRERDEAIGRDQYTAERRARLATMQRPAVKGFERHAVIAFREKRQ